jgi:hypothetical protein
MIGVGLRRKRKFVVYIRFVSIVVQRLSISEKLLRPARRLDCSGPGKTDFCTVPLLLVYAFTSVQALRLFKSLPPAMTAPVFKISPGIQSYAWGKKGSSSLAAQLGEKCISDFKVDEGKTYAEVNIISYTGVNRSSCKYSYGWVLTLMYPLNSPLHLRPRSPRLSRLIPLLLVQRLQKPFLIPKMAHYLSSSRY